jgi:hypothetical protein
MALKYKTSPLPLLRVRRSKQQCVGCRKQLCGSSSYIVNTNGTIASADLGNSSNYSNEIQHAFKKSSHILNVFVKL